MLVLGRLIKSQSYSIVMMKICDRKIILVLKIDIISLSRKRIHYKKPNTKSGFYNCDHALKNQVRS